MARMDKNNIPATIKAVEAATAKALTAAAIHVQGAAINFCSAVDTGNLKGSITYKVGREEARIGTNVHYAPYIEYGTGIHAEGGDGRKTPWVYFHHKWGFVKTRGSPAQPFLRPALDKNERQVQEILAREYKRAIEGATR